MSRCGNEHRATSRDSLKKPAIKSPSRDSSFPVNLTPARPFSEIENESDKGNPGEINDRNVRIKILELFDKLVASNGKKKRGRRNQLERPKRNNASVRTFLLSGKFIFNIVATGKFSRRRS